MLPHFDAQVPVVVVANKSDLVYFVWCERALNEKMNLFSPISAYLAAIAWEKEDKAGVEAMCDEYAKYTRTPGYRFSHGHIWACSLLEYGVEHAYRTHAGHCVVQAAAIGAALELSGIDCYRHSWRWRLLRRRRKPSFT